MKCDAHTRSSRWWGCSRSGRSGWPVAEERETAGSRGGQIVIAEIVDKTGPAKDFNNAANPGYDMAFEDMNKAGGIKGRTIKVVQLDAASQPTHAPLVLREAAKAGAVVVIGPLIAATQLSRLRRSAGVAAGASRTANLLGGMEW